MSGDSNEETLQPNPDLANFAAWFTGLFALAPSAYSITERYLKEVMPDLQDIKNQLVGPRSRTMQVQFGAAQGRLNVSLDQLSDGEKCFLICSVVLAAATGHGPVVCVWDEPDSYLALAEVSHFIGALRSAFHAGGQFIATSHHPEAIRRFSDENTLVLHRRHHLEPTQVHRLEELNLEGDLITALTLDDLVA
jgi:ABC-type multidrug transport system ATPase subunit